MGDFTIGIMRKPNPGDFLFVIKLVQVFEKESSVLVSEVVNA